MEVTFSQHGRIPLTGRHFPPLMSRRFPRQFSDNVLLIARKPVSQNGNGHP
jgi:hypothetical protein